MDNVITNLILAIIPGIIWLFYFLRKDRLPEPKLQIIKIFFLGAIVTIPTAFVEFALIENLNLINLDIILKTIIKYIFIIGLIEELFKYIVVRYGILKHSSIDEPIDIPLYMIISALGFATLENILAFNNPELINFQDGPVVLSFIRFIGPTFLHALCSGLIGCFLAFSFYSLRFRWLIVSIGFILSIFLHGLFDFYIELGIMNMATETEKLYPLLIIIILAFSVSLLIKEIKKIKSICKI